MLNRLLTIAGKESTDAWRDRRAMFSSAAHCLMGPGVVWMVSLAIGKHGAAQPALVAMMSIFTLLSAFVGGMNVAMDSIAGERERRSLLPLLMHPVTRLELLLGKWLAVSAFSAAGLALNVVGFAVLLRRAPAWQMVPCLLAVPLLAAALQVWVSTACRGVKEANTYLSMLVFLPMGLGMFLAFSPSAGKAWWDFLPLAGQQLQLEVSMRGGEVDLAPILVLTLATVALAMLALFEAADRLERDDAVYGS